VARLVLHVISGLRVGGAELALHRLLDQWAGDDYTHEVVALTPGGELLEHFRRLGREPAVLDVKRRPLRSMLALVGFMRRRKPAIVQTWMYHADLMGGLAARAAGIRTVLWGIRCTDTPSGLFGGRAVVRLGAWLSHVIPQRIVCCAEAARTYHERIGYRSDRMCVIPNGCRLEPFAAASREKGRARFGLLLNETVIGMVGRFDLQKDHQGFVRAAGLLAARMPQARFLMIGPGVDGKNPELAGWIRATGFAARFVLAGQQLDMPNCYAAMDVLCSSSCGGEGFPNVVCEAMATGVPCVVTDVGDSAAIVGNTGAVVAPADPQGMAEALFRMLACGESGKLERLGAMARARVEANYSLQRMEQGFTALYDQIANPAPDGFGAI